MVNLASAPTKTIFFVVFSPRLVLLRLRNRRKPSERPAQQDPQGEELQRPIHKYTARADFVTRRGADQLLQNNGDRYIVKQSV
jgi:hypothetical protein